MTGKDRKMRERYTEKLLQVQKEVTDMGRMCEEALEKTYQLLISEERRKETVEEIDRLEREIDGKEQFVEGTCIQMLLRQQPVAADLRRISAALKMITDMERIGDQAIDIAEIIQTGSIRVPVKEVQIGKMAELAMNMLNCCMEAYMKHDLEIVRYVIECDDQMDSMFLHIRRTLTELETGKVFTGDQTLDLLMISKYYERIADHITNIAEWIEFSMTGIHRSGRETYDVFGRNIEADLE